MLTQRRVAQNETASSARPRHTPTEPERLASFSCPWLCPYSLQPGCRGYDPP